MIKLTTPITKEDILKLKIADEVLITGTIYTARDAAHEKLIELIDNNKELPFDLKDAIIYYVGPSPARPGETIGSAGPTSAYRMDEYAVKLMGEGSLISIGKGDRGDAYKAALKTNQALYFSAVGGLGALISKTIKSSEVIAYPELGAEAIRKLYVEDFPVIVSYDTFGGDLFLDGKNKYRKQ